MVKKQNNRMLEFLWLVAYCGEFPAQLASRIGGHPEWNRHVLYRAIEKAYVTVYRGTYRRHVVRSLRITDAGIDYISKHDPARLSLLFGKQQNTPATPHSSVDKVLRIHALATGFLMSRNAGARALPAEKPTLLLSRQNDPRFPKPDPDIAYFYSMSELRSALAERDPQSNLKGSRCIGVIVRGHRCFFLYYTGFSRMYWMQAIEDNFAGAVEVLLRSRGFSCTVSSQIVIGNRMELASRIVKYSSSSHTCESRYFQVSHDYNNCFYILNSSEGDQLLSVIIDPTRQLRINRAVLKDFSPATNGRVCDAVTGDGLQPVFLAYRCDLLSLMALEDIAAGFRGSPIVLCADYQVNAVQTIVGPMMEVRAIPEGVLHEA